MTAMMLADLFGVKRQVRRGQSLLLLRASGGVFDASAARLLEVLENSR
jgi:hypothetical protein